VPRAARRTQRSYRGRECGRTSHPVRAPGWDRQAEGAARGREVVAPPRTCRESGRFALLLLGHRDRLMFETLPSAVIAPTVGAGFAVDVFGYLENSTMARAFRGRRPMGNPAFARLSDAELHATISRQVALAGGEVVDLLIAPRPAARVPADMPQRLSRYSASVKKTVATRMLKERIGLHLIQKREAALGTRYTWVLWTREDSHWFAPLRIHHFDVNEVHGKSCGGFGGWNDKVWLMGRKYADTMLSMYSDWLEPRPAPCSLFSEAGRASAPPADFLQAPSIEQFRERVGLLHRVPYRKHPPEKLPTMDSFYQQIPGAESRLCFPVIYSKGCVPKANQTLVDSLDCGGK